MKRVRNHPPKPGVVFRVGVAGTRNLLELNDELAEQIRHVLLLIQREVKTIHGECDNGYDPAKPPRLVLICALAEGADQLVAGIASEVGYEIQAPLAYPRSDYASKNFANKLEELKRFEELLSKAKAVLELDGRNIEEDAYDAAGSVLVSHSDVLLAVVDGSTDRKRGGTLDSIQKATRSGIPVVSLRCDESTPGELNWLDRTGRKPEELSSIVRDILQEGLRPPDEANALDRKTTEADFARERSHLQNYYDEIESRTNLGKPYDILTRLLAFGLRLTPTRLESYEKRASELWSKTPDEISTDRTREFFMPIDMWADGLSLYYAKWMRGAVASTLSLGAVVLIYPIVLKFWPDAGGVPWLAEILASFSVFSAAWVTYSNHRSIHRRWLEYRMLSERLRKAALALAIGGPVHPYMGFSTPREFTPSWVRFYFKAMVRSFGLGDVELNDTYLRDYSALLRDRVGGQSLYYAARKKNNAILNRRIRRFGLGIFCLSFLGTLLQIVDEILRKESWGFIGPQVLENLTGAVLVLTIAGAAVAAFAAQENFARIAQVSAGMATRLANIESEIRAAPLNGEALREKAGEVIQATMQEHEDWYLLYSLRGIEYA